MTEEDLLADAQRAHPLRWPVMSSAEIAAAIEEAWASRLAEWVELEPWEPPAWIEPGTDLSFLPAWDCGPCGQRNSGWSRKCGRCSRIRPMDPHG